MGNEKFGGEVLLEFFDGKCLMHKCPMGASSAYGGEENDKREKGGRGEENHSITLRPSGSTKTLSNEKTDEPDSNMKYSKSFEN